MKERLLFVCSANSNRSPTFERYFKKNLPQYDVRSTGIFYGYPHQLNKRLLDWADRIFVMDLSQALFINKEYPQSYDKIEIVGISDQYSPDRPELIELIEFWIRRYFKKEKEILDGLFTGPTMKIEDIKKSDLADEFYLVLKVDG